ncbi:hypothetical protein Nepgr_021614 [Nepenthes gracilis]|uniref:Uncharacterized protein n=1 Tax=Nepenthes gracilis TaxID=150966 RepID=A0AAD3SX31_NEPGR|nr:hypothetical protein Nepgr_021614 [Nepenthes gracilis]
MDRRQTHLLTNGVLDVLEPMPSTNDDVPAHVAASLPLLQGQVPQVTLLPSRNPIGLILISARSQVYSTPSDSLAGCGNPFSLDGHHAGDNSQYLNLGHDMTSTFEQEATDANHKVPLDAKTQNLAPGVDGVECETSALVSPSANHNAPCMMIRPEEVTCFTPSEYSPSGFGLDSKSPSAAAVSVTVSDAVCSGASSNVFGGVELISVWSCWCGLKVCSPTGIPQDMPELLWAAALVRGQKDESETPMPMDGAIY